MANTEVSLMLPTKLPAESAMGSNLDCWRRIYRSTSVSCDAHLKNRQSIFHKLHLQMKTGVREGLSEHIATNGLWVCHACATKVKPDKSSSDQRGPATVTCSPCEMIW